MRPVRLTIATLVAAAALAVPTTAAWAQYGTPTLSPTNRTTDEPPAPTLTVQGGRQPRPGLGVTGADVAGIAAIGLGSVGIGGALVARSRRRRSA